MDYFYLFDFARYLYCSVVVWMNLKLLCNTKGLDTYYIAYNFSVRVYTLNLLTYCNEFVLYVLCGLYYSFHNK